jgi:hypothetical protein
LLKIKLSPWQVELYNFVIYFAAKESVAGMMASFQHYDTESKPGLLI